MLSGSQHCIQASDRAGIISVAANLNWAAERLNYADWDGLTANPSADPDLQAFEIDGCCAGCL